MLNVNKNEIQYELLLSDRTYEAEALEEIIFNYGSRTQRSVICL